uniref:Cytochrome c oxidase subunit 1 n=1 Tax=Rozella allomycis TaxID=281847 RepID=R9R6P3_9FUNG|nr:cytochrome c oxidase subunit 1 [Rozella allomycis]AGK83071.1 cytochrome c oxidase subunit 1 [Rozella allomycis]
MTRIYRQLCSTNAIDIGIMYSYLGIISGIIGTSYSFIIRLELINSGIKLNYINIYGSIYNNIITNHGLIMLFYMVIPLLIGNLGNILIPIIIGSLDMTYSRLNNISYLLLLPGFILFYISSILYLGYGSGWTLYVNYSLLTGHWNINLDLIIIAIHIVGISSIVGSINFITTIIFNKHIGLTLYIISLYNWCILITSILIILSIPILGVAITFILLDRNINTNYYNYLSGGSIITYQYLFWLFGHIEVYILIIPGFGIISEIISYLTSSRIFGNLGMVYSIISISILGFIVMYHHMFSIGLDIDSKVFYNSSTIIIGLPTGIKIYSWITSLYYKETYSQENCIEYLIYIYYFISLFIMGGVTGIILSSSIIDLSLHDTYFVVGHFHMVLSIGVVMCVLLGIYYYLEYILGIWIIYEEIIINKEVIEYINLYIWYIHSILLFIGVNITFIIMHIIGLNGLPRRYSDTNINFNYYNTYITLGSIISLISLILYFIILINKLSKCLNKNNYYFIDRLYINRYIFYYININRFNSLHYLHNSFNYHHTLEIPII